MKKLLFIPQPHFSQFSATFSKGIEMNCSLRESLSVMLVRVDGEWLESTANDGH